MLKTPYRIRLFGFCTVLFCVFVIVSCSKEGGQVSILEFMESNYFETDTKLNGELYSYNLIQFDFSSSCVMRLRSQHIADFNCYWDGLDECQPLLYLSEVKYYDDSITFKAKIEESTSEDYPYEGSFIIDREFNDVELWLNGTALGGYKMVSKEAWDKQHAQISCED